MTSAQRRALTQLSPHYLAAPAAHEWPEVFGRTAPLGLEIGFGMGQALLDWCAESPETNLVGIDVYEPGIGALLAGAQARGVRNLRVLQGDARALLPAHFAAASIQEIRIWFPDPWPKKRHHKRRLIQPPFVAVLASRLVEGGRLRLATDWENYAESMAETLAAEPELRAAAPDFAHPATRYAARGQRLGHSIQELSYIKESGQPPRLVAASRAPSTPDDPGA